MDEQKPLLEDTSTRQINTHNGTRIKIMIYVMLNSLALSVSGSAQTQYIYAYVKNNEFPNRTSVTTNQSVFGMSSRSCKKGNNSDENDDQIQERASEWAWYITLTEFGIAIFFIMFVGPIVDKIGRKPLLLWNQAVTFLSFVIKSVVIYQNWNLYYFLIGSAVEGLSGTYLTFHLGSLTILADVTSKDKERTFIMALYDALLGVGVFFSYVGVGYLIKFEGFLYPFVISAVAFLLLTILIAMTLTDSWKAPVEQSRLTFFDIPVQIFSLCINKENRKSELNYFLIIFLIFFLSMLPFSAFSTIRTIYTLGWPFCWSPEHLGWYGALSDLVLMVGATIILKIIHNCCTFIKDELMVIVSLLSSIACLVLFGISKSDWMIYGATSAGAFRILTIPILKAILSRITHPDKQGAVMSNIYLIEAVCTLGGTTLFNNVYHQTIKINQGLVFFSMAGLPLLALILMIFVMCTSYGNVVQEIDVQRPDIQRKDHA